jgi:isocitrate dehydrogenase kinase/phosphatase
MRKILAILLVVSTFLTIEVRGQEIVKKFLNNQQTTSKNQLIYLTFDERISLVNDNINRMFGFESLEKDLQDELRKKYTRIIDKVNQEEILKIYNNSLIKELRRYGFTIYRQEYLVSKIIGRFNTVNVSQIELEEFTVVDSLTGKYYTDSTVYYKTLTGLRMNVWLEYNWADTTSRKLLFISHEITDEFSGYTEDVEGKKYADYELSLLNPNDAYIIADKTAALTARYMYNFLMNKYVKEKTGGNHEYYYSIGEDKKIKYSLYKTDYFEELPIEE